MAVVDAMRLGDFFNHSQNERGFFGYNYVG
jgi:hypothetical protein